MARSPSLAGSGLVAAEGEDYSETGPAPGAGAEGPRRRLLLNRRFSDDFPITALLLLLVVGFYVLEVLVQQKIFAARVFDPANPLAKPPLLTITGAATFYLGSLIPTRVVEEGEVWRCLTCVFLHGGALHILFNALILYDLGRLCEPRFSSPRLLTLFVLCGLGGAAGTLTNAYLLREGIEREIGSVGASGALAGLIGMVLVYAIRHRHTELRDAFVRWIIWIALISLMIPRVDHAGHIGGLVTGGLLGLTLGERTTSETAARWRIPAWIAGACLALSLAMGIVHYFRYASGHLG